MPSACLADRSVISVSGADARAFLDRLVTCSLDAVLPGTAGFGALLTPQGKIISDFIVHPSGENGSAFLLDVPTAGAVELAKRLVLYRLRAKIVVEDRSEHLAVVAGWGDATAPDSTEASAPDPRLPALGWRAVVARPGPPPDAGADYDAHRMGLGIPVAGSDFPLGDAFPHEAMMDQLGGVDFRKGCYVGQEVVSRMQHRGTARNRIVPVRYDGEPAPIGSDVTAGDRILGRTGTSRGQRGLATLRLDRAADALAAGEPILAGGVAVRIEKPDWAHFPFPGEPAVPAA